MTGIGEKQGARISLGCALGAEELLKGASSVNGKGV